MLRVTATLAAVYLAAPPPCPDFLFLCFIFYVYFLSFLPYFFWFIYYHHKLCWATFILSVFFLLCRRVVLLFNFYLLIPFEKQTVEGSYGEVTVSVSQSWPHRWLSRYAASLIIQWPCVRCMALSREYSEVK